MEANQVTLAELIELTKEELVKTRFSKLTLKGFERVWINLEKYSRCKGIHYFSIDIAMAFLRERYQYTETARLSSTNQRRLRAIQLLADFKTHQKVFIEH